MRKQTNQKTSLNTPAIGWLGQFSFLELSWYCMDGLWFFNLWKDNKMYLMFGSFKYSLSQPKARIFTHWPMQCENTVSKKCEYGVLEITKDITSQRRVTWQDFRITHDFQNYKWKEFWLYWRKYGTVLYSFCCNGIFPLSGWKYVTNSLIHWSDQEIMH